MEVAQVMRMKGGLGEASYAHNSLLQRKAISVANPIIEDAVRIMHNLYPTTRTFVIADMGCSAGPNTFLPVREIIVAIRKIRRESAAGNQITPVHFQVYFNDLPGNDFNTIFRSLPSFKNQLKNEIGEGSDSDSCFVYGAPSSFYGRVFDPQSLHFVHASYSLHFLSQVPKGIGRSNKSCVFLSSSSPISVINAYYQQFQTDFTTFLKCRSEELVTGGCIVLGVLGRKNDDHHPGSKEASYFWQLPGLALAQMVSEGLVEEEKLDEFNFPIYSPCPAEIESAVKKEGSFVINSNIQVAELDWATIFADGAGREKPCVGVVRCLRSVTEPMLADQFGQDLMDEVFRRCTQILDDHMNKERAFSNNLTISLRKIA